MNFLPIKMRIVYLDNNGQGDCLFRSCAYHLGVDYQKLRQQVANIIRTHPQLPVQGTPLSEWINMAGHNYSTYSEYIAANGVYGSGIELMLISIMYKRCIRVFKRICQKIHSSGFQQIAEYFPQFGNPVYLLFSGPANQGHYEPIIQN
jgi:hypothetical protein